jgi:hypothetical protein
MIAFDLASLSFGTSLLQRLQQFAAELSQRVRKCCLLLSKLEFGHPDFWRITTSRILDVQEKN